MGIRSRLESPTSRIYLGVELALLFVVLPVLLFLERHAFRRWIIPTLLGVGLLCLGLLLADPSFDRRRLWNRNGLRADLRRILRVFVPASLVLALFTALLQSDLFFRLPRDRPGLWLVVLLLYPLLSVYPQEIIFRAFLFHRYRSLLPGPPQRVAVSALAFGLAHLLFANWIALVLSTLGGVLFATTYRRTDSLLAASIEHSVWGDLLFTIGLGWYFYGGVIGVR